MIPDLIERLNTYDCSKKEKIPYSYSLSFVEECCQVHNLLVQNSFPKCFPVLEILSMWFRRALVSREKAIAYHQMKGEELETLIAERNPTGMLVEDEEEN